MRWWFDRATDLLYILAVLLIIIQSYYMFRVYKNPCHYCYIDNGFMRGRATELFFDYTSKITDVEINYNETKKRCDGHGQPNIVLP